MHYCTKFSSYHHYYFLQKEIDTHLTIITIQVTSNYAGLTDSTQVHRKMTSVYARPQQWHYTGPNGVQPDLHYAMLGRKDIIGFGKSWVGTLCNPTYAFAFQSYVEGGYTDMNSNTVWDLMMVSREFSTIIFLQVEIFCKNQEQAHARMISLFILQLMKMIGYNFGAYPTHTDNYSPRVDRCGQDDLYDWLSNV